MNASAKQPTSGDFYVVGIGGSAGALAAFGELLSNMPRDIGLAFVIIQHLSPDAKSNLSEILSTKTKLAVTEAKDNISIKPNHVYVIPPNENIFLADGKLLFSPRKHDGLNLPINEFFLSLASVKKQNSIGVVLSGGGSDGMLGIKAIREAGGVTFAQDATSEFPNMPKSAISSGVDYVLSPREIANKIIAIATHPLAQRADKHTSEPDKDLGRILSLLERASDVDFTYYKPGTIRRRIVRRMLLNKIADYRKYADYLEKNPKEIEVLYQDILIKVTDFFRDKKVYDFLKLNIFPGLVDKKRESIRIWVPGCATGEEAYSLAIMLAELMEERGADIPVQIFGTDLSEVALNTARNGVYPESIEVTVPRDLLSKFFSRTKDGKYKVAEKVRAMCAFARHNMLSDIPFSRLDIVSCRNVLIYLDSFLQKKAFPIFHYALNPEGLLILGTAETVSGFSDLFKEVHKEFKIYTKKSVPAHRGLFLLGMGQHSREFGTIKKMTEIPEKEVNLEKEADAIVLSKHAPAGLIVNDDLTIVQFRGDVSPYLRPIPGRATFDLLKMVHKRLLPRILEMLVRVRESGTSLKERHRAMGVEIEVIPLGQGEPKKRHYLVLFKAADESAEHDKTTKPKKKQKGDTSRELEDALDSQKELSFTIEQLQKLIETRDVSSEELKAAHEELMSTNEELQSTNEELETTKEELQSANEELMTLNSELEHRNLELENHEKELYRKDEFLSFLGHELRNPLSPIIHSIELAKLHGITDPELREAFAVIERQAKTMNALVKDLLDAARAIGGKIRLNLQPADMNTVVKHAVQTTQPLFKDHVLDVRLPEGPVHAYIDPVRIEQILVNLLSNSAKYTPKGGKITTRLEQKSGGGAIVVSVEDTGMGIAPEVMPLIFNLFSQAQQSLSNFKGGLGVGLMVARTLADLHGGSLSASSPGLGKGSTFTLTLPAPGIAAPSLSAHDEISPKDLALKKKKILVVDDNTDLADTFGKLLAKLNQEVRVVYTGEAAGEAVHTYKPDMIFIDVAMPTMSGYDLIKALRKESGLKKTRFIAMSGFGEEFRKRSQGSGFDEHLVKPIGIADLAKILSRQ